MKLSNDLQIFATVLLLFLLVFPFAGDAQQNNAPTTIRGKVTDVDGIPLTGAIVNVKERGMVATVAPNGSFAVEAAPGETIEVSFFGYSPQSVIVQSSETDLNIVLEEDALQIERIVVVGYGTTSREKLTGAVTTVSTDDFASRPITDVGLALQGKATGVLVTQNSGQPGGDAATITIRGIGTLNNSSPLVVIDGFESTFDKVDPKDIESVTVLKDAASAAIYGNKAANGVILITTKKGRSGKIKFEYNGYVAVQSVTRYPKLLGSVDFLELYNEARANSGLQPAYTENVIEKYRRGDNPARYPDRNWADFYFKPAVQQNHYIKMSGGNEQSSYLLSGGYLGQDGILEGTSLDKFSFRSNVNHSFLSNRLRLTVNLSGFTATRKDLVSGSGSTLARIVQMQPTVNPKIEGYGWTTWFYNDAVLEAGGGQTIKSGNFNGSILLQFDIRRNLTIEGAVNYDRNTEFNRTYAPNVTLYAVETGLNGEQTIGRNNSVESQIGESSYRHGNFSSYATITWQGQIADSHNFKLMAGGQQYRWDGFYIHTERKRLTANLPSVNVGDPSTKDNTSWETEVTSLSAFGRFNYDYKSKYLFEANFRYDGSSKFAKGHKWGAFPSFSAGWRISQESFMQNASGWLNELKIRVSWGRLGNENIWSAYAGTDILSVGTANYIWDNQNVTGSALAYLANRNLTWETTTQKNFGLDLTLFSSLSLAVDYYVKYTDNILMQLPVSGTLGFTETPWQNAGSMRNTGFELSAAYSARLARDFDIILTGTFSTNCNRIIDLKGASPIIQSENGIILQEGLPINTLYRC